MRLDSIPAKCAEISWQPIEGEVVLIDRDEGELIRLNELGAEIWQATDGQRTVEEIIDHVYNTFEVKRRRAQKDVIRFLKQLYRRELINELNGVHRS
ncbi:MAG: PqqD family protein [Candidatus Binatia bacterium]